MLAKHLQTISAEKELAEAYCTYALSTLNRALPSAIDGLKISQRRVLQTAFEQGFSANGKFHKVAKLGGLTCALLHPHGSADSTAIEMAQLDKAYRLLHGHGNYGGIAENGQAISNDGAASSRYLEIKLSDFAEACFDRADMPYLPTIESYAGDVQEITEFVPLVPFALLQSQLGIGTGWACDSPAYNLAELCPAILAYMSGDSHKLDALQPDWLSQSIAVQHAPQSWKRHSRYAFAGNILMISSLPDNSAERFCSQIAELVQTDECAKQCFREVRDLSNSKGICIELKLSKHASLPQALGMLYRHTCFGSTYTSNMTLLHEGMPIRYSSLVDIVDAWLCKRIQLLQKRFSAELSANLSAQNLQQALQICISRKAELLLALECDDVEQKATEMLADLPDAEALARQVLSMSIRKLGKASMGECNAKLAELRADADKLHALLDSPQALLTYIARQMQTLAGKFGRERSTEIAASFWPELCMPETWAVPVKAKPASQADIFADQAASFVVPISRRKINSLCQAWVKAGKPLAESWRIYASEHNAYWAKRGRCVSDAFSQSDARELVREKLGGKNMPSAKKLAEWEATGKLRECAEGHIAYWALRAR